jgi:hypothetical protein
MSVAQARLGDGCSDGDPSWVDEEDGGGGGSGGSEYNKELRVIVAGQSTRTFVVDRVIRAVEGMARLSHREVSKIMSDICHFEHVLLVLYVSRAMINGVKDDVSSSSSSLSSSSASSSSSAFSASSSSVTPSLSVLPSSSSIYDTVRNMYGAETHVVFRLATYVASNLFSVDQCIGLNERVVLPAIACSRAAPSGQTATMEGQELSWSSSAMRASMPPARPPVDDNVYLGNSMTELAGGAGGSSSSSSSSSSTQELMV